MSLNNNKSLSVNLLDIKAVSSLYLNILINGYFKKRFLGTLQL